MLEDNASIDRRQYLRVGSDILVKVEQLQTSQDSPMARSKNISQGGLLFQYSQPFAPSVVLSLELRIPQIGRRIECYGKVVRCDEVVENKAYDVAVAFVNIDADDMKDIGRYIDLLQKEGGA